MTPHRWMPLAMVAVLWSVVLPGGVRPVVAQREPVQIHAAVTGPDGTSLEGLGRDDLEVTVDGKRVAIETFAAPPAPLSIVLLLDMTMSMTAYTELEDEIGKSFAPSLQPGDRARVGGIGNRLVLAPQFSSNAQQIVSTGRKAVSFRKEDRSGISPIWDAVDAALTAVAGEPGLKAIVLATDGRSTGNSVGAVALLQRAAAAGVVVQVLSEARPIVIRQTATTFARIRPGLVLEQLARYTGGLSLPEEPAPDGELPLPGPIVARLVRDLRGMYRLGVRLESPPGSMHAIQVTAKRPGVTVRAPAAIRSR